MFICVKTKEMKTFTFMAFLKSPDSLTHPVYTRIKRIVRQVDYLLELYRDARSPEYNIMQSGQYFRCGENVPLLRAFQTEYLILLSRVQCFRLACHCCLYLLVFKKMHFPQTSPPQNIRYSDQELHRHQLCLIPGCW